jgi:hypothetical protein
MSGVLQLAGKRYPFSGRFSRSATFSTELTNGLYLSFQGSAGACFGIVSNDTWSQSVCLSHGRVVALAETNERNLFSRVKEKAD